MKAGRACRRAATSVSAGFTLAEVLVVLVVIGLAAGLAYARLDADPRQALEREARRLGGALEHAALLAQWKRQTLGISAAGTAYRFWRRDESQADGPRWVALSDDDVLAPHALPPPLSVAMQLYAGAPVPGDAVLPLAASGRNEPYVLALASPQWQILLASDPLNRVALVGPTPR
ncbi:MAG TPA: prepilin-type N-terminal cleavage/methylation domain-containing protein [Casimicrobiaceae bacterium]|nr:prepilin-type N-terminal cleavage/methylation domain-containing protein [Casimicrobiaceae bacterium]